MHVVGGWWYALVSTFKTAHLQRIPAGCRLFFVVAPGVPVVPVVSVVSPCCKLWLLVCQCCPPAGSSPVCPPTNPGLSEGKAGEGTTGGKTHFQLFLPEDSLSWIVYKIVSSHLVLLGSSERVVPCKMCPEGDLTTWPGRVWQSSGWSVVPLSSLPWVSSSAFSL